MKKIILLILTSLTFLGTSNCATSPLPAVVFGSAEYHISGTPAAGPTGAKIVKSGKSCANYSFVNYLFYAGGEGSIAEAIKEGGIKKVAVVDRSVFSILAPIFSRECVVVYGE